MGHAGIGGSVAGSCRRAACLDASIDPRAHAGLLLIEIGNSHVSIATSVAGEIYTNARFGHDDLDAVENEAAQAWDALPGDRRKSVAACSVVPGVLSRVRERISARIDAPVMVVGDELHRPMSLAVESPQSVGIDRICSAAAAYDVLRHSCAIASFGTAITIDCVNDSGAFLGGAILPGLAMQARSLHEGTAQLPEVGIRSPTGVYGETTEEAILHGVVFGVVGSLREIVERYATELTTWPDLVATGGNAELIARHTDIIDRVVPDLCLRGIALAHRRHYMPFEAGRDA